MSAIATPLPTYEARLRTFSDRLLAHSLIHWDEQLVDAIRVNDEDRARFATRRRDVVCDELDRRMEEFDLRLAGVSV